MPQTGEWVCTRCGSSERRKGGQRGCAECHRRRERERRQQNPEEARARARAYQRANREANAARAKAWREKNPERFKASLRLWYAENPEKALENRRRWRRENVERDRELARRRYYLRRGGGPEAAAYAEILRADPCSYCGEPGGTADHIIPVAQGGANDWSNLTGACGPCNSSKSASTMLLWMANR